MTKQNALDKAAQEAGYEDFFEAKKETATGIRLYNIVSKAMDLYAEYAFYAGKETNKHKRYIYPTFKDWSNK